MSMLRIITILFLSSLTFQAIGQTPNNCNGAVPGCTTPSFGIEPNNPATNIIDFTSGSISNPSTNPNPGNAGCLLSGETSSTFISINIVSSGTLAWSIIGPNGGCFDWIMWPYVSSSVTCAGITGNTLPPVSCNWNGTCNGNTGMAPAGQLPPNGSPSSYEAPLNVTAGQSYLLCLSNYSGTSQNVNLNFFGTAQVVCGVSAIDQTICLGNPALVTIATPGLTSPTFNWLVTNGVSNTTGGTNVSVNPTVTTTYQVEVYQAATATSSAFLDTAEFTITVATPPAPNAGPDQTVCLGQLIQLTGAPGSPTNQTIWQSLLPPGLTPPATATYSPNFNSLTPTVTVNQPGLYKFILRETSSVCGTIRDTVSVLVSELTQTLTSTDPTCSTNSDGSITVNTPTAIEYQINGGTWQTSNVFTGLAAGTYNVCSRNNQGCSKCGTITLVNPAPVVLNLSNDTLICHGGTATLIASATNGTSFTYTWGHSAEVTNQVTVSPIVDTYYDVFATNSFGCSSEPDSIYVTVRSLLTGTITPDYSICPGYPEVVNAGVTGGIGAPYTYTWSTGEIQTGTISTITPNPAATQTISVSVTDGCETPALELSMVVTVIPLPVPQFEAVETDLCEPAIFELTNTTDPSRVGSVVWNLSTGDTYTNPTTIFTNEFLEGAYSVQMIVTSPEGCIDSVTYTNYLVSHGQPTADFTWNPNPVLMFNTSVSFSNLSDDAYYSNWVFESGTPGASQSENPVVQFPDGETGDYEVTLYISSEFGCLDTITKLVPVLPEILLYVPNTFTPDGDEYNNDWFAIMEGIDLTSFELNVYNRWGQKVFQSFDLEAAWDGTYAGTIVPAGIYTWTIRAKNSVNDAVYECNGYVQIMR